MTDLPRKNEFTLAQRVCRSAGRCFVLAVVLVTTLTFFARQFWLSDLLANLRIQQVIGFTVLMFASVVIRQFRSALIIFGCILVHVVSMWGSFVPATSPILSRTAEGETFTVMTINVLTQNRRHHEIVQHLKDASPDVVAVLELGTSLQKTLNVSLAKTYPFQLPHGSDHGNFGIALYSKFPFESSDVFTLNEPIASIEARINGYRVIATHPLPPMGASGFDSRNEHLSMLSERVTLTKNARERANTILMGDFNLTPWSPHFEDMLDRTGLHRARQGFAIQPTWYARKPWFPLGLVLDHVLIGTGLSCTRYSVGKDVGSDHRSVTVTVQRRPTTK